MSNSTVVAQIDPIARALAQAVTFEDFKAGRDMASAALAYAKARKLGRDAENHAAEYILRNERGMGESIKELKSAGRLFMGGREREEGADPKALRARARREAKGILPSDKRISLDDLDVTPNESMNFQRLADIPVSVFEDKVAGLLATGERFAKLDFYRLVKGGEKVQKTALADIREAMHSDDATPAFRSFEKAAMALDIDTLPEDELVKVAGLLRDLLASYNARYARRAA